MSGNVSHTHEQNVLDETRQIVELTIAITKAVVPLALQMTKQQRQMVIGVPTLDITRALEQALLPVTTHTLPLTLSSTKPVIIPDGWSLYKHNENSAAPWDPARIRLYFTDRQRGGQSDSGVQIRAELKHMKNIRLLNVTARNDLYDHQHLIPKECNGQDIHFWGTLFYDEEGRLCVPSLYQRGDRWHEGFTRVSTTFAKNCPAAYLPRTRRK